MQDEKIHVSLKYIYALNWNAYQLVNSKLVIGWFVQSSRVLEFIVTCMILSHYSSSFMTHVTVRRIPLQTFSAVPCIIYVLMSETRFGIIQMYWMANKMAGHMFTCPCVVKEQEDGSWEKKRTVLPIPWNWATFDPCTAVKKLGAVICWTNQWNTVNVISMDYRKLGYVLRPVHRGSVKYYLATLRAR